MPKTHAKSTSHAFSLQVFCAPKGTRFDAKDHLDKLKVQEKQIAERIARDLMQRQHADDNDMTHRSLFTHHDRPEPEQPRSPEMYNIATDPRQLWFMEFGEERASAGVPSQALFIGGTIVRTCMVLVRVPRDGPCISGRRRGPALPSHGPNVWRRLQKHRAAYILAMFWDWSQLCRSRHHLRREHL